MLSLLSTVNENISIIVRKENMANENVQYLTSSDFKEQVSSGYTLVDFWAEWCGPCKALAPTIDKLANTYEGQVKVGKVNVDENQDISAQYSIRGLPTVMLFKDGQPVDTVVGYAPQQIETMLHQHIN